MRNKPYRLSIQWRAALVGGLCLLLLSGILSALNVVQLRRDVPKSLRAISEGLTYNLAQEISEGLRWGFPLAQLAREQTEQLYSLLLGKSVWAQALRFVGVIDAAGTILVHSAPTEIGNRLPFDALSDVEVRENGICKKIGEHYVDFIPMTFQGAVLGYIITGFDAAIVEAPMWRNIRNALGVSLMIALCMSAVFLWLVRTSVTNPLRRLAERVTAIDCAREHLEALPSERHDEIGHLTDKFNQLIGSLNETREKLIAQVRGAALGTLASQVAHDIRSPLAALEVATTGLAELPEEKRLLVRGATARIRDIANSLIAQSRASHRQPSTPAPAEETVSVELLSSLIDPLVTEKRLQHRARGEVEIQADLGAQAYGLFARVQPTEFKRALSNLVNNAVEGLEGKGTVQIRLRLCDDTVCVEVADTGKGIPEEILSQLTQRGATFGKSGGSGLGLYHAREQVEAWGGTLAIASTVGQGTTVTLRLPAAAPAPWFVPALTIRDGMTIVVLDDDQSIHDIWEGRFAALHRQLPQLTVRHCTTLEEVRAWHATQHGPSPRPSSAGGAGAVLYLVDYELIGQPSSGLALIAQLQIQSRAILVTSRYEDPEIRARCAVLGVQLIPKGLAGFVPIQGHPSAVRGAESEVPAVDPAPRTPDPAPPTDYVFIDDDENLRLAWQCDAKRVGKTLQTFAGIEAFLAVAHQIAKTTPIYVDSNLGGGIKGEEVAKTIHDLGFQNIYLATGYNAADFGELPWLKGIRGKDPPWVTS